MTGWCTLLVEIPVCLYGVWFQGGLMHWAMLPMVQTTQMYWHLYVMRSAAAAFLEAPLQSFPSLLDG